MPYATVLIPSHLLLVVALPSDTTSFELIELRAQNAKLQAELLRTQTYNRLVLDSAVDYAVITADTSGLITDWSEGAKRILGWDKAQMLGQPIGQIFTPEDRTEGVPEKEIGTAISRGRAENDRWHLRADGDRFMASGIMMPMRQDNHLVGVIKILRDVTQPQEQAAREQQAAAVLQLQFQQIAESVPQLVWISDEQGQDLYFNPQWTTFSELPVERLMDHAWHRLIAEPVRERVAQERARALREQQTWEDTFQMRDAQGREHWFICRALPIRDDAGRIGPEVSSKTLYIYAKKLRVGRLNWAKLRSSSKNP